jgi:pSer/pThr/pTyr-binding forkhead associated (FHA) protein
MIINIGRNKKNDVVIENLKVSNTHAQLIIDEKDKVYINDLQSENGTFVNGNIINELTELSQSDVVKLANYLFEWKKHIPQKNQ